MRGVRNKVNDPVAQQDPNVGGALRAATSLFVYDGQPSVARQPTRTHSERSERLRDSRRASTSGNVVNLVDPVTDSTTATYEYSPFGRTLVAHGPLADEPPIRFSTKCVEDLGQLNYLRWTFAPGTQ